MATEKGHPQEIDLDRTDKLPILVGAVLDPEIADDATPLPQDEARLTRALRGEDALGNAETALMPMIPQSETGGALSTAATGSMAVAHADFLRPSAVDLPSLAESMRSVEERIARQQVDYEALSRSFERSRDSERAALSRVASLEQDSGLLRSSLEAEQARVKEYERGMQERQGESEAARARAEEALLEAERHSSHAQTLKDSLASRDATIVQVLHSLGERDAQLAALQQDNAKLQQAQDEHLKTHSKLQADLGAARAKAGDVVQQLASSQEGSALLSARVKRAETEVNLLRAELGSARAMSSSYLEQLRTREFRRGFDENLFRELDAKVGAADVGHGTLIAERDRLQSESASRELKFTEQAAAFEKLKAASAAQASTVAQQAHALKLSETASADWQQKFASTEAERARLSAELNERNTALAEARAAASGDVQRITQRLEIAEQRQSDQAAQIATLQSEHAARVAQLQTDHADKLALVQGEQFSKITQMQAEYTQHASQLQAEHAAQLAGLQTQHRANVADLVAQAEEREQEMLVLMAHLKDARKPLEPLESEIRRLTADLAGQAKAFDELNMEVLQLRSALERTRGALEEREFLIRRLERAESNNANVLGRIQTSMERLGSAPLAVEVAAANVSPEWSAELVRIDGERNITHTLGRRTRIGRASGCELQVDSTSVSRHHALVVAGPRETVIEDLNSTNGVIVNGRKISRAFLNDGDVVIVGDVQFRFSAKASAPRPAVLETPANN